MLAYTKICSCAFGLTFNPAKPDSPSSKLWREFTKETANTRGYRSFFYGYRKSSDNVLHWMIGKGPPSFFCLRTIVPLDSRRLMKIWTLNANS